VTVSDIRPRIVEQQLNDIEKMADAMEVIIEHEEDDDVRAVKEDKLHELRKKIDAKRKRLEEGSSEKAERG